MHATDLLAPTMRSSSVVLNALLLIAAGFYQFLPIKNVCLSKCRLPLGFLLTEWRDGWTGAVTMGLRHGLEARHQVAGCVCSPMLHRLSGLADEGTGAVMPKALRSAVTSSGDSTCDPSCDDSRVRPVRPNHALSLQCARLNFLADHLHSKTATSPRKARASPRRR
jgi:hypothetical protein